MGSVIIYPMIKSFRDESTEDVFDGRNSRAARSCCLRTLWTVAQRKLDQVNRVQKVSELAIPPGNPLERLYGEREDQYSIRINQQYRICFRWEDSHAYEVEIVDYH
jgi:proteic killer suppression protein